jgi:hypothetical protein
MPKNSTQQSIKQLVGLATNCVPKAGINDFAQQISVRDVKKAESANNCAMVGSVVQPIIWREKTRSSLDHNVHLIADNTEPACATRRADRFDPLIKCH